MNPLAPIERGILDEAALWLARLHGSQVTEEERNACLRWREANPEHARAWARAEILMNSLGQLPPSLAMPALNRPRKNSRRAFVGKIAGAMGGLVVGWGLLRLADNQQWTAQHRTAKGERKELQLADGSRIELNTASAIDVQYDALERLIVLRAGEILIQTGHDVASNYRPFRVMTAQGRLEALGTRFTVRQDEGRTRVAVLEGAVRIEPRQAAPDRAMVLSAGQQSVFTDAEILNTRAVDEGTLAWRQGMLLADGMRLADFAAELARYHTGFVRYSPAIAEMRISGGFPIDDVDRTLSMLVSTYPLSAGTRMAGYWIEIGPR